MQENTKDNMVIPIRIEQVKQWIRWTLEATSWLVCLGLLAASVGVSAVAALTWLVSGSEVVLVLGLGGGLALGLAGIWQLLRQVERAASQLRQPASAG